MMQAHLLTLKQPCQCCQIESLPSYPFSWATLQICLPEYPMLFSLPLKEYLSIFKSTILWTIGLLARREMILSLIGERLLPENIYIKPCLKGYSSLKENLAFHKKKSSDCSISWYCRNLEALYEIQHASMDLKLTILLT